MSNNSTDITINAVEDKVLREVLDEAGLLEAIDRGEGVCYLTGEPLSWDTVGGVVVTGWGPRPFVASPRAFERGSDPALVARWSSLLSRVGNEEEALAWAAVSQWNYGGKTRTAFDAFWENPDWFEAQLAGAL